MNVWIATDKDGSTWMYGIEPTWNDEDAFGVPYDTPKAVLMHQLPADHPLAGSIPPGEKRQFQMVLKEGVKG